MKPEAADERFREVVTPTEAEIHLARKRIRQILGDGEPHSAFDLESSLLHVEGLSDVQPGALSYSTQEEMESIVSKENPTVRYWRYRWAAASALSDLEALGTALPVNHHLVHSNQPMGVRIMVNVSTPRSSGSVAVDTFLPTRAPTYRLAYHLSESAKFWFLDPGLFTDGLDVLQLDQRTARAIDEAIAAYRRGLFLAACSLLGVGSEGAWYAAGEQLQSEDKQLAKALDEDRTAKVVSRVAELLRRTTRGKQVVDGLLAQESLMRRLRNYGVHPRGDDSSDLERYFTETGAMLLMAETHNYLETLNEAVRLVVPSEQAPVADN